MRPFSPDYPSQPWPLNKGASEVYRCIIFVAAEKMGATFTSDDVTAHLEKSGLIRGQHYSPSDMGASFQLAGDKEKGFLECLDAVPSQRPEARGHLIRVWRLRGSKTGSPVSIDASVPAEQSTSSDQTELIGRAGDA